MTDLTDFGVTIDSGAWYDPGLCHALVDGDQCSNGYETESSDEDAQLCWQHADADRLRRVDDYPDPALDLRDELLEETEIGSSIALGLSTLADDVQELWELLIEGGPLEFGGKEHSERAVPNWAADVAQHPSLDVDDHLWSHKNCIAITGKGDRCPNSGYGPTRMCGMHQDADDPDTILDEADDQDDVTDEELLEAFAERGGHASDSHVGLDVVGSAEATGELRNAGRFESLQNRGLLEESDASPAHYRLTEKAVVRYDLDVDGADDQDDVDDEEFSSWDVKEELGIHGPPAHAIAETFDGPLEVISYHIGADGDFTDIDGIGEATSGELANVVTHDLIPKYGEPGTTQWRVSQGKLDPVEEEDAEA